MTKNRIYGSGNKYKLPFSLIADPEKSVIKAYGAWGEKACMVKNMKAF
jgi:peroxiredoxin